MSLILQMRVHRLTCNLQEIARLGEFFYQAKEMCR